MEPDRRDAWVALDGPSSLPRFASVLGLKSPMPTTPRPVGLGFQMWKFGREGVVVVMRSLSHQKQKGQTMQKFFRHTRVLAVVLSCLAAATTIAKNLNWLDLWPR